MFKKSPLLFFNSTFLACLPPKTQAKGADKMQRYAEMQKWYKEDNGKAFQKEFFEVINEVFNGF